jgi:heme oxygenase
LTIETEDPPVSSGLQGLASSDPSSLSDQFRLRTRLLHRHAERSGFIAQLLRGGASLRGYGLLLRNLLPVYEAMELALEARRTAPVFRGLAIPAVYRARAIEADLGHIFGDSWSGLLPMLPGGAAYVSRIAEVAAGRGEGLIAHAYVRYLGDLNGGQVLKRRLGAAFDLSADALSFYEFPEIRELETFKTHYRQALDRTEQEVTAPADVIEESAIAFELNIGLSEAIAAELTRSAG